MFKPNTAFNNESAYIYIPTNASYDYVHEQLEPLLKDIKKFDALAKQKKYVTNIKAGRYIIKKGMNNNEIIISIRSNNLPIKLSFNNQETLKKLAGRISIQIEADSLSLLNAMLDETFLSKNNFNKATALGMYIPNSYEFFWNTNAEQFRDRMLKEYNRFWNDTRINKAKEISSNDINLILLESNIKWELGDVESYKSLISQALEIDPSNADLLFNLGVVSADNDDIENAKIYYNKAISVDPKYTKAYLNIAALILSQEEGIIEEMNSLGTSNADYNRYDDLQDVRNNIYKEAIPYLETILSIENNNISAARTLRNIYSAVGDEVNYKLMKEKVEGLEN